MRVKLSRVLRALPDVALAAIGGPLAVGGIAKVVTPADKLDWPVRTGPLSAPHGAKLVGTAEMAAVAATIAAPGRVAALTPMTAYAALSVAAYQMKGTTCACFGAARLASVGRRHVGANAAASVVAATVVAAPGHNRLVRTAVVLLSSAVTYGTVRMLDRRRAAEDGAAPQASQKRIESIRLYVSAECPACRSLKHLVQSMEPARREAISTTVISADDELPETMSGLGVPCALGLDEFGECVSVPVSGIGNVKALIDSITLSTPELSRAG